MTGKMVKAQRGWWWGRAGKRKRFQLNKSFFCGFNFFPPHSCCQTAWPCLLLLCFKDKTWCFISCAVLYLRVYLLVLGGNDQLHQSDLHSELHRGTGRSINTSQSLMFSCSHVNTHVPLFSVPQMASYFGYSVAVTDLNGDGYS